jgi:hypothetical protein
MEKLGFSRDPEKRKLYSDAWKVRVKGVLSHNRNVKP